VSSANVVDPLADVGVHRRPDVPAARGMSAKRR
jgi:hypothetical protein